MFSPDCVMNVPSRRRDTLGAALLIVLLALPLLVACTTRAERPPLKVVATIAPLADWARQVGQERVTVTQLVPTSANPRDYTLTEENRRALAAADVLLFNGLGLEPWFVPAIEQLKPEQAIVFELAQASSYGPGALPRPNQSRSLLPDEDQPNSRSGTSRDVPLAPAMTSRYLWLDPGPNMAQRDVILIADTFARLDEANRLFYRSNAERYNGELENLDFWIKQQIRDWPRTPTDRQQLLAMQSIDLSWDYFARRYNIVLRTTANLKTYNPPLPDTTPLFVDQFVSSADQYRVLGLRKPDAVLNPLAHDSYIELLRTNVTTMIAAAQQAAANQRPQRSQQPTDGLLTP